MAYIQPEKEGYPLYYIFPAEIHWCELESLLVSIFKPSYIPAFYEDFTNGDYAAFAASNESEEIIIQRWLIFQKLTLIEITSEFWDWLHMTSEQQSPKLLDTADQESANLLLSGLLHHI